ncbi:helix-turn-helix transcriptional regulator [Nocardioides litoris]|uniref:helix-turn-helix transcriptional regulator n=1 Tax=Nocardioides litoris TaxID=1926648 RepID=UPI0011231B0D|nr:helix-turn-helix transcriptional regulator [Nocardioides litoris]
MVAAVPLAAPARSVEPRDLVRRGQVRAAAGGLVAAARAGTPLGVREEALLLQCHLATGDLVAAQAVAVGIADSLDPHALMARAELAAALGDHDAAHDRSVAAGAAGAEAEGLPWRCAAALALLHLGHRERSLDLARTALDHALATGTAPDVALAMRTLASCDTTTEAWSRRVPRLREALAVLADAGAERLQAQVQADLAALLLLDPLGPPEALGLLRRVEAYAGREGLAPLQGRARRLLEQMGEQPRRLQSEVLAALTAAERRVAVLVLEGLTNREIADRLVVSVKAVEGHLSKVYRKLGLASRTALVAAFNPG